MEENRGGVRDDPGGFPGGFVQLLAGNLKIQDVLGSIADGARLVFGFTSPSDPLVNGAMTVTVGGGAVSAVKGSGAVASGGCVSTFSFDEMDIANLNGEYPTARFDMGVQSGRGTVEGMIDLDGAKAGAADVMMAGGQTRHQLFMDLETGEVTPLVA